MERLEPGINLLWHGAVRRNGHALGLNINVALKSARAFGVGHKHRRRPVMILVRGEPNRMVWIAVTEIVDLIELNVGVFRWVKRDAMVDGKRNVPIREKRY